MASNYRQILEDDTPLDDDTPCGYCRMPMGEILIGSIGFEAEHIIPQKLAPHLVNMPENLVWACRQCNNKKGGHINGYDSQTKRNYRLFNPRKQSWRRHFAAVANGKIYGHTQAGRSSVARLAFNTVPSILRGRARGFAERWWPAPQGWRP